LIRILSGLVEKVLTNPVIFEWQQGLCNNYDAVGVEFRDYLTGRGQRILDIGCSTGTGAGEFIDMSANEYYGIDISPEYTTRASQRHPAGNFLTMDARKMTFDGESFDVVVFLGVLHHMHDDLIRDSLKEVQRVLKRSGRIVVGEPLFTKGAPFSNFLLSLDRGKYIRDENGYKGLFETFQLERERFFRFSAHRFHSLVYKLP
jgi:ubiquinone/menaquinone biosynthesis C-methylase UbiE